MSRLAAVLAYTVAFSRIFFDKISKVEVALLFWKLARLARVNLFEKKQNGRSATQVCCKACEPGADAGKFETKLKNSIEVRFQYQIEDTNEILIVSVDALTMFSSLGNGKKSLEIQTLKGTTPLVEFEIFMNLLVFLD